MGAERPPADCSGTPVRVLLPPGERLLRVHRLSGTRNATAFNRTVPVPPAGGRFDTVDGTYGHLYVATSPAGAVAEALLRNPHAPTAVRRFVPRAALAGRAISELEVVSPTQVVSLKGPDVGHVCQDGWLTTCESAEYPITREWGAAIRTWVPDAAGMLWWARPDNDELSAVFYDDRPPMPALRPIGPPTPIDSGPGFDLVIALLAAHNVTIG